MMKNIVVIGCGGIGSRHLQALSHLNDNYNIYAVDPSLDSIKKTKEIIKTDINCRNNIKYHSNIDDINVDVDVAIIAVTSSIRRGVTEELISKLNVKNIIFEKILFNKLDDYYCIKKLLELNNISAWVNCARRSWLFYNKLRTITQDLDNINLKVTGNMWGLGCNSIHMIDLLSYLSNNKQDITLDISGLDKEIINSKRKGYVEFTGCLSGSIGNNKFELIDSKSYENQIIYLSSDNFNCMISESAPKGNAMININSRGASEKICIDFDLQYQSTLTHYVIQDIIMKGNCDLPTYEESMNLHIPLISAFLKKVTLELGPTDICNIT